MNAMRPYFLLFTFTFLFRLATALPLEHAGYMDASYALHIAENLTRGQGLVENILWNYLDQPTGLPHPSNLYWMPLPSLLIAPLFAIFGATYRVAQVPFIVLSSLLPLVAFHLSRKIFARDDFAWAAGLFTAFSGFYTIYWVSPDNFTPFALTASLCLFAIARGVEEIGRGLTRMDADGIQSASVRASAFAFFRVNFAKQLPTSNLQSPTSKKGIASSYPSTRSTRSRSLLAMKSARYFFLAGILAALSHLSRADGVLLLGVVPIALLFSFRRNAQENAHKALDYGTRNTQSAVRITHHVSRLTLYALLGYLLTMAPW
ncbi:MAG: hypothetical protein HY327_02150, partial [Chloroflexi bacterium]|nr:hypothetical protein [Chloroflexota bacterium]